MLGCETRPDADGAQADGGAGVEYPVVNQEVEERAGGGDGVIDAGGGAASQLLVSEVLTQIGGVNLVKAPRDRTYPRVGGSGATTRDIELKRLFRRGKRRGQDQKHKRHADKAKGLLSDHSISSPSWSALFTGRDVTARYQSFLRQKRGNNPGKNLVVDSVLDFSRKW